MALDAKYIDAKKNSGGLFQIYLGKNDKIIQDN